MKKHLYLIGGTMGVGKTTVCHILKTKLDHTVFLDGDWCWDMSPFLVTDETKAMVHNNIACVLNNFLKCSEFHHVIFCWVMHEQEIIDEILYSLNTENCEIHLISLICSEECLEERLKKDIKNGIRSSEILERSKKRLPLYTNLNTEKIDTSVLPPAKVADEIIRRSTRNNLIGKEPL